jgi:predicted RNase H-like nuclease (RuvC/YqgF family)
MISGYKEEVKITVVENPNLNNSITMESLQGEIRQLRLMLEYQDREKQRLRNEIEELKNMIRRDR